MQNYPIQKANTKLMDNLKIPGVPKTPSSFIWETENRPGPLNTARDIRKKSSSGTWICQQRLYSSRE